MRLNFGTPLSRSEMKNVMGGVYSTCSTACPGGGTATIQCVGGCTSNDGVSVSCGGNDTVYFKPPKPIK